MNGFHDTKTCCYGSIITFYPYRMTLHNDSRADRSTCEKENYLEMMDKDLGKLYEILDCQQKKSKPGDELKESVIALERKYAHKKRKEFIWKVMSTWVLHIRRPSIIRKATKL